MFENNHDGCGYMYLGSDGYVHIHKGFTDFIEFYNDVRKHNFTSNDVVIYHFRISTQARRREMTHPFVLSENLKHQELLNVKTNLGIVHNGIIRMTTDYKENDYSDTCLFISKYMTKIVHSPQDLLDSSVQEIIEKLIDSKMATLDNLGNVTLIGKGFLVDQKSKLIYSNDSYKERVWFYHKVDKKVSAWDEYFSKKIAQDSLFDCE